MKNSVQAVAALSAAGTLALVQAASNKGGNQDSSASRRLVDDDGHGRKLLAHHVVRSEKTQARRLQNACTNCHVSDTGTAVGPSVFSPDTCLFGKPAGTTDSAFAYSRELTESGLVWNETTLDQWLEDPAVLVNGTKMIFAGLSDPQERQAIIDELKQNCLDNDETPTDAPSDSAGASASIQVSFVNTALMSAGLIWFMAGVGRK